MAEKWMTSPLDSEGFEGDNEKNILSEVLERMINVHDHAHSLARALKESQEHRAFKAAQQRIKGKPTAEKMVADFHQKQLELQSQALQGKEPTAEQKEALERLYSIIQGDPDVREYLMAEQRLGILLNDVYKIIGDALDVQLPGKM